MEVHEIEAKTVLVVSKLPDTDYVINPYTGCSFGCAYCYASYMGRFVGETVDNWGNYVYVKTNAPEVLARELDALSAEKRQRRVLLSSVTDAYQHVERKYKVTRRILGVLVDHTYPGTISILTKSPLVLRDVDLLARLQSVEVGFTITTTDDLASREMEVRAPLATHRLEALKELQAAGISTYAFVGPLLPHFYESHELLDQLFAAIADTGVTSVFVEHMNLKPYIRQRLVSILESEGRETAALYGAEAEKAARIMLDNLVQELTKRHGLSLRLGRVLTHGE